ncbi:MAG: class I SAM-dependent methyltransferase [Dehalococcoidia bacterium]|nr:class I SAM-dependent methyltransferase [Dehalococcoidia bacterium]
MSTCERWDASAATYDTRVGHGLRTDLETAAWAQLFERLFPPEPPLRILDIGTGTGFVAFFLADLGHEVTGLDYSHEMLAVAERKAKEREQRLRFVLGEAEAPPPGCAPPNGFDAVVSRHVIWTLPQPERAIERWAGLLTPGGRVVAIDGIWSGVGAMDSVATFAAECVDALRERRRPERMTGDPLLPLRHLRDPRPAENAFRRAGLVDVRSEPLIAIDRVERSAMSLLDRLRYRWRRYLVEGTPVNASHRVS